jgi:steroid delta-isomerase
MFVATDTRAIEAVVEAYVRHLNAQDVEAVVALYADDASVEDPVGSEPIRGRAAIRRFYAQIEALQLQVRRDGPIRAVGRECAFALTGSFVQQGVRITFSPIDTFRFDEAGRITQMRAYFGPENVSRG